MDTSAVLTFTDQEDGAGQVEGLLQQAQAGECTIDVCALTLMELYYVALRAGGDDRANRLIVLVKAWPVAWIYPDEKHLLQAGRLKAHHRLSVADAIIAAVAKLSGAILVHKDPELIALNGQVELLTLPLKQP